MTDFQVIKKIFWNFIKNNGKKIFYTIIFSWIIISIFELITPFFYKEVISVIENYMKTNYLNTVLLYKIFIYWWIFIIVTIIFKAFSEFLLANANLKNYKLNHLNYSKKIFNMRYEEYLNEKSWSLFKKYDRWQENSLELIYIFLSEIFISSLSIILISIILFIINIKMAMATLVMVPIMILIGLFFNLKTRKVQDNINILRDKAFWIIWDWSNNLWLIKTLNLERKFLRLFKKEIEIADKKQKKVAYRWVFADIYASLLIMISRFIVLLLWIYLIKIWELDFATLFLFFTFIWHIYFPLAWIFRRLQMIQKKLKGIKSFYEKFDKLKQDKNNNKSKKLNKIKWEITFKNVKFAYKKWEDIFNNLSFKINSWEKIAFVWNTWAGKSTIVSLLFRFWDINSWEILLDWENINNISKDSLRKNIWLVMQDNSLFNTTILENLKFANSKATIKEIEKALKNAEAHFVFKLKNWIKTLIGERWLKLSWWEKQRLSIARLFLKNPKILILDEATSALDNKTENLVQKALDKLLKWRTSIVIAHRLTTIQNADKIFMLENWEIVESWNYKQLIKKKGKFYNLANTEHLILN